MILLEVLWFFLPAGIANMAPVLACRVPGLKHWNTPLDFHWSWRGTRIFGNNKTWRGLLAGVIAATLVSMLQQATFPTIEQSMLAAAVIGAALGFGALAGDATASFFKRQRAVPSGQRWVPFDQMDYIVGGLLVVYPFAADFLTLERTILILALFTGLHFLFSYFGYLIGVKERPI